MRLTEKIRSILRVEQGRKKGLLGMVLVNWRKALHFSGNSNQLTVENRMGYHTQNDTADHQNERRGGKKT